MGQERLARYLLSALNARSAHLRWNKAFTTETEVSNVSGGAIESFQVHELPKTMEC